MDREQRTGEGGKGPQQTYIIIICKKTRDIEDRGQNERGGLGKKATE